VFDEDLVVIKCLKAKYLLNKPIYVGVVILELSKLTMYKFHYDYIKQKYNDKCKLLFADTDSLTYHIYTEDLYKEYFDRSDYNMTGYRSQDNTNKNVVNKMKDETNEVPIKEFIGLRSKCYSILLDDRLYDKEGNYYIEKKTAKGVKKSAVKKVIIKIIKIVYSVILIKND
jgi:hypothetical protein